MTFLPSPLSFGGNMLSKPDLRPSLADDPGWAGEVDSFGGRHPVTKQSRVRESVRSGPPETSDRFDDTLRLAIAYHESPLWKRLREAGPPSDGKFSRGVPTNDTSSTTNYPRSATKIIDGEHKTLLALGKITEAMEDDEHPVHLLAHRILLADPNLSETQRSGLIEHITDHTRKNRKKLKAVQAAKETGKFKPGLGRLSRALPATQYDVIPQDADVDTERKRTAGNMAMEARMHRFDRATQIANRRGL
jgi:hypothetical protein